MEITPEILEKLEMLRKKYEATDQDLVTFLDGLFRTKYNTYWDYIQLDTLLTLQNPKTDYPDEEIFIMYHQITELFFKLALHELEQIAFRKDLDIDFFVARTLRINRYFRVLTMSFDVMTKGMEIDQYLEFRNALVPASGFQSVQYRMIEICATDLFYLVQKDKRHLFEDDPSSHSTEELFEHIYWKQGASDMHTGKKTYTLLQFEEKYTEMLLQLAEKFRDKNLWARYKEVIAANGPNERLTNSLKQLDADVNVNWPISHYKTAVQYLMKGDYKARATGGSNWQKYLSPQHQQRVFYPELWTESDLKEWGRKRIEVIYKGEQD